MGALYWFYADRSHLAAMDYDLYFLFYQNSEGKTADIIYSTDNRIMLGRYNMKEEIDNPYPVTVYARGNLDAPQYTIDRQNETIRTKTGPAPKKRTEALGVISAYSNIPGLAPEAAAQLKGIANSIKNGNNALIAVITKTKPATEAAFAEADISAWSKIVPTNINAGEEGIVMLAAQGKGGTV
jgi:hypothetical protein